MEPDRFQHSPKGYVIGMICMLISMVLFGFGAYVLPNIAFGLSYRIPAFFFDWIDFIQLASGLNESKAAWLLLMIIFFLGLVASTITYALSIHIENEIYVIKPEKVENHPSFNKLKESGPLALKIDFMLVVIFIGTQLFQWVISNQ